MVDFVEDVPNDQFRNVSYEEVIDWIVIDYSAPVVEEMSVEQITESVVNQ